MRELQLHCVYDNTASNRPSGYGSDKTGEMCNQYLLSDLRLQTRGWRRRRLGSTELRSPGLRRRRRGAGGGRGLWVALCTWEARPSGLGAQRRGRGGAVGLDADSLADSARFQPRAGRCAATKAGDMSEG